MVEIVINYDKQKQVYKIYEPSTDTLMASTNLTEALLLLNKFLIDNGFSKVDILNCPDISYHIDSLTMRSIVEGNINLLKRLQSAPSSFMMSSQRFGGGIQKDTKKENSTDKSRRKYGQLSGASNFKQSFKKFGSKY